MEEEVNRRDPFSSIEMHCLAVTTDEEELEKCGFTEGAKPPEPSRPTGGSVGESSSRDKEEFVTPPVHRSFSLPYVFRDDRVAPPAVDLGNDATGGMPKKIRVSEENLGMKSPVGEIGQKERVFLDLTHDENTEIIDLEDEEDVDGFEVGKNGEEGVDLDKDLNGDNSVEAHLNWFKHYDSGNEEANPVETPPVVAGSPKGRRRLPPSITGGDNSDKNVGWVEQAARRALKDGNFKALLGLLYKVAGKGKAKASSDGDSSNDNDDFFEIAKVRGMTFPQPRWWPPEGFGDH